MTDKAIDTAARAYAEAAVALADLMLEKLSRESPDIAAKAAQALTAGERMQLLLEFSKDSTSIVWQMLDDYEHSKRLMTIPGVIPSQH